MVAEAVEEQSQERQEESMTASDRHEEDGGAMEQEYAEATSILLGAQAVAQQEENIEELPDNEVVSVEVKGQTITLQTIAELAAKGNKREVAAELGVSLGFFRNQVLGVLAGGEAIEFSYYCREEGCPQSGICFGVGTAGLHAFRGHAARNHKKKAVTKETAPEIPEQLVRTEESFSEAQEAAAGSPLLERIRELEVRASEWTAVEEEARSLEARLVQIEEEKAAVRARLEELQTANPEAWQAAELLAKIRELVDE